MKIIIKKKLKELSSMGGGGVQGHVYAKKKLDEETTVSGKTTQDDSEGYESEITLYNSKDDIEIKQVLVIHPVIGEVYGKTLETIKKCYPKMIPETSDSANIKTYDIDFSIKSIYKKGKRMSVSDYAEGIFTNKLDSLKFFRQIMKEVKEYVIKHLDYIYSFTAVFSDSDVDVSNSIENKRTQLYRVALTRLFKSIPGDWHYLAEDEDLNDVVFFKCPSISEQKIKKLNNSFTLEEQILIKEVYNNLAEISQASGLTGYNLFPKASAEDEHDGHVKKAKHQKIKNVMEEEKKSIKIKIKKSVLEKKDKRGASPSYCRSTACKEMGFTQKASCKSQGIKDCYRGKKKN